MITICLFIGIVVIFIIWALFRGRSKDTLKQIGLATSIKNTGFESPSTILLIRNIIMKTLTKEGFHIISLNIVHEFQGRYQGIIQTKEHGQTMLKIIADHLGNLQWSEVD